MNGKRRIFDGRKKILDSSEKISRLSKYDIFDEISSFSRTNFARNNNKRPLEKQNLIYFTLDSMEDDLKSIIFSTSRVPE